MSTMTRPGVTKTYYALKKLKAAVSIPRYDIVEGKESKDGKKGKRSFVQVFKTNPQGGLVYENGEKVPVKRIIRFETTVRQKGLDSYCIYSTDDPTIIQELDKKCLESHSSIISEKTYEKNKNPEAYEVKQKIKEAKATVIKLEIDNENLKGDLEGERDKNAELKRQIEELKSKK